MLRTISQIHLRSTFLLRSLPTISSTCPTLTSPPASVSNSNNLTYQNSPNFLTLSFPFSSSQILGRRHNSNPYDDDDSSTEPPKLFVVQPRLRPEPVLQSKLLEALNLANSLEEQRDGYYATEFSEKRSPPHLVVQNPVYRSPRADTYFGPGTVDTVKCNINALKSEDMVDAIFVNATLTSIQQRNLERAWGKPVLDRVGLIIEIFNAHAQTKEAKLQAELAALMYKRSRLVRVRGPDGRSTFGGIGEMEVVSARGRGSGGQGFMSGAGETELQLQKRRISDRRTQLLFEIKEVRRTRALQRASRRRRGGSNGQGIPTVAIVGYTNAGKSTLVSSLSDSYLFCDDRLFATVDPKLSSVVLPSGRQVLLSDTVGFISDLPVQLVEAFHATLEDVVEADLLVHVLDSSSQNLNEQREAVLQVLEQIGVSKEKLQTMIEVWNKIDIEYPEVDIDLYGDEEVDKLSGEGDDIAPDQLSCSDVYEVENSEDERPDPFGNFAEDLNDNQGEYSDGWLAAGGQLESWVDYDGSSLGQEAPDNTRESTIETLGSVGKDGQPESEVSPHVKTSAVTGVGLQELLELIDERLESQNENVVERSVFDRKWRPPRSEERT